MRNTRDSCAPLLSYLKFEAAVAPCQHVVLRSSLLSLRELTMGKKTAAAKRSPAVKASPRKGSSPRKGGAFPNVNEMVSAGSNRGPDIRDMQVDDDVNLYITKYSSDGSKYDDAFLSFFSIVDARNTWSFLA